MNEPPLPPDDNSDQQPGRTIEPPPLPPSPEATGQETFLDKAKTLAKHVAATAKSAAMLTAKQTERTKLLNVSLPQAFTALGKQVYSSNSHREDFAELFNELDDHHLKIEELESRARSRPSAERMTDKAKAVAAATKDKAETQGHRLQISRMMAKLGKAAYMQHGKASGPEELIVPVEQLLSRRDVLDQEIQQLSNEGKGGWITPKRVVIGAIIGVVAVVVMVGMSLLSGNPSQSDSASNDADDLTSRGLAAFEFLAENPSQNSGSDRLVGKPLTVTGNPISVVNLDGKTRLDLDIPSLGRGAICWFRGEYAKELYATDDTTIHVNGNYQGIAEVGRAGSLELVDCRLVSGTEMAEKPAAAAPPATNQPTPSDGRPLEVRIGTAQDTPSWIHNNFNPSLQNVTCHATDDQLIIDFDVDTEKWIVSGSKVRWRLPLIIRLADRNGNVLTFFTTTEGFTVFPESHRMWQEKYESVIRNRMPEEDIARTKCELLKPRGNRLVYSINIRDLRDAAIVEIGFYQER